MLLPRGKGRKEDTFGDLRLGRAGEAAVRTRALNAPLVRADARKAVASADGHDRVPVGGVANRGGDQVFARLLPAATPTDGNEGFEKGRVVVGRVRLERQVLEVHQVRVKRQGTGVLRAGADL